MKKKILALSVVVASLFAADYQIGGGFGRSSITDSPLKNYNFGNVRIGKYLPKNHILRMEIERATSVKSDDDRTSLTRALLNVEYDFKNDSKLVPYAFMGAGYQWLKGDYDNSVVADLGVGAKYNVAKNLDLFLEGRALRDFHNNDKQYGVIGGFVYNFGEPKAEPAPKPEPVKVIDSDNDGVADSLDKCPNTPAGVKVDKNGCAIDSDNDGVADSLDKCPNTPAGVKVDKNGCPIDSDHDGVLDYLDKCPNTPKGMKVDKNGCAISFNFDITFDTNSAKIKPEFMPRIEKFAEFLKDHPGIKAEIQGYTDNRGKYDYNILLSEKRAKAVYEALIKLGVNKDQITWAGYGPKNPIASNDTKEGRAKNRRVVGKIIY